MLCNEFATIAFQRSCMRVANSLQSQLMKLSYNYVTQLLYNIAIVVVNKKFTFRIRSAIGEPDDAY